jgi:hypothetical protein
MQKLAQTRLRQFSLHGDWPSYTPGRRKARTGTQGKGGTFTPCRLASLSRVRNRSRNEAEPKPQKESRTGAALLEWFCSAGPDLRPANLTVRGVTGILLRGSDWGLTLRASLAAQTGQRVAASHLRAPGVSAVRAPIPGGRGQMRVTAHSGRHPLRSPNRRDELPHRGSSLGHNNRGDSSDFARLISAIHPIAGL